MTETKPVRARARLERRRRAPGLSIAQLHRDHLPGLLDPFLAFDHFEMAEPFFPPHPHAGFSAVTYMFPQSAGGFINRDSAGDRRAIRPGDLHWTAAGRGVVHEEVPAARGVACQGLQIFVNLHSSQKWSEPAALHLHEADVPRAATPGGEVRVVAGRHGGLRSPLRPPTDVTLLDVVLGAGESFEHEVPAGETRFLYVLDGELRAGPDGAPALLSGGDAVGFGDEGALVRAAAGERPAHFVLAGGRPLREPVVFYGPFCMTSRDEIERAVRDYEAGRMGRLEPSF
ncbi:MAG TPA: pirin-like C-terminal cupin domain-containing protein [Polyangiaceae bacterium]|nr:pirin-like C-terminal cupin domain-containing protein [Polyangiaceae bacterium]